MSALEEYRKQREMCADDERRDPAIEVLADAAIAALTEALSMSEAALAEYHDLYGDYGPNALTVLRAERDKFADVLHKTNEEWKKDILRANAAEERVRELEAVPTIRVRWDMRIGWVNATAVTLVTKTDGYITWPVSLFITAPEPKE
jgi:hypothetical protein